MAYTAFKKIKKKPEEKDNKNNESSGSHSNPGNNNSLEKKYNKKKVHPYASKGKPMQNSGSRGPTMEIAIRTEYAK